MFTNFAQKGAQALQVAPWLSLKALNVYKYFWRSLEAKGFLGLITEQMLRGMSFWKMVFQE